MQDVHILYNDNHHYSSLLGVNNAVSVRGPRRAGPAERTAFISLARSMLGQLRSSLSRILILQSSVLFLSSLLASNARSCRLFAKFPGVFLSRSSPSLQYRQSIRLSAQEVYRIDRIRHQQGRALQRVTAGKPQNELRDDQLLGRLHQTLAFAS